MKKLIIAMLPFAVLFFSCEEELVYDISYPSGGVYPGGNNISTLPGTSATFTLIENGDTFNIQGDARPGEYGFFNGPGSAIHEDFFVVPGYETYEYKLECIGSNGFGIAFELFTTYTGQPIDQLKTGMYNGRNSGYTNNGASYLSFHNNDPVINQQLSATVYITKINGNRIDGSFSGKYYQTRPATGQIITIKGEFKNVYIHKPS